MNTSKSEFMPIAPHSYDTMKEDKNCNHSKLIYSYTACDATELHYKYIKWKEEIGLDLPQGAYSFAREIQNIYKVTNITKYRSFQYRLLLRGVVTNIQLYKWNIAPNERCYFCQQERESIVHLMCNCEIIKAIWNQVALYIKERFDVKRINISTKSIIMNQLVQQKGHAANFICLIVKQYIYSTRCQGKSVTLQGIKNKIRQIESVEKYIAIKNSKEAVHTRKWGNMPSHSQDSVWDGVQIQDYVQQYVHQM